MQPTEGRFDPFSRLSLPQKLNWKSARPRTGRMQVRLLPGVLCLRSGTDPHASVRSSRSWFEPRRRCFAVSRGERLPSYGSSRRFDSAHSDSWFLSACSLVASGTPFGAETTQVRILSCRLSVSVSGRGGGTGYTACSDHVASGHLQVRLLSSACFCHVRPGGGMGYTVA